MVFGALVFKLSVWWRAEGYVSADTQPSNEIFSPSNKIHREVGLAKDLTASRIWMEMEHG